MRTVYLDASAAVKLVVREPESGALRAWLGDGPLVVSSALIRIEVIRAVRREEPGQLARARRVVAAMHIRQIDDAILDAAASLDPKALRSLDAIHLATAQHLADELDAIVTYDRRMIEGARALGLPTASPT